MIKVKLKKWLFFLVLYFLKLKGAYKKYGNQVLFERDNIQGELKTLIESARKNVLYYKENFPAIENDKNLLKSFAELDFSTHKSQLKKNVSGFINPSFVSEEKILNFKQKKLSAFFGLYKNDIVFPMSTGGSTGSPLNFYMAKNRGLKFIFQFFAIAKMVGWKEGEPHMVCMQGGMYQQSNLISRILPLIGTPAFVFKEINAQTALVFTEHFNKYRPVFLFSSPSFLAEMANQLETKNIKLRTQLKGIMCIGEMLMASQRTIIERFFEVKIFNIYASNEMGTIAVECAEHNGLHILEGSVLLENDVHTNIIATAFGSECLPFIKYNTGDVGKIEYQECLCGIKGKKITDLQGRIEEYIIDKNENRIHASYLRQLLINTNLLYKDAIISGQFVQKFDGTIDFKVQLNSEKDAIQIINHMKQEILLLCGLEASGSIAKSLVPDKGKFRFFYRELIP